ncbi:MAG: ATP-binding protein [Clostridia bacterium]|nr:ATP-binding protein [Clostridia bacterium]
MIKPINIYLQSRISEENAFNIIKSHSSNKREKSKIKKHEILSLARFVDGLIKHGVAISMMDGFFYGYEISQIGKEFDLLKLSATQCLNIEFKSQQVSENQILNQLVRNHYYLKHLGKKILSYTVITDTLTCYKLCDNSRLQKVDFIELASLIKSLSFDKTVEIDKLFKARNFLVSPLVNPQKFINGEYFLTQAQEQVKKKILSSIINKKATRYYSIVGHSGTGKTLLLYDLARSLAKKFIVVILHCGRRVKDQEELFEKIGNLKIFNVNVVDEKITEIENADIILIDEAQRLSANLFATLCNVVEKNNLAILFSLDPTQVLSKTEEENDILSKINAFNPVETCVLSDRIRTNRELFSFTTAIMDLKKRARGKTAFSAVSLCCANDIVEAKQITEYFKDKNYAFINYLSWYENFGGYDIHQVIGQDFDKVVMLMDNSFYYDENGKLQASQNLNSEYIFTQLFYQGITRAKEKLALVVVDNKDLFDKISQILSIK